MRSSEKDHLIVSLSQNVDERFDAKTNKPNVELCNTDPATHIVSLSMEPGELNCVDKEASNALCMEQQRTLTTELLMMRSKQMHKRKMVLITTMSFLFIIIAASSLELNILQTLTILMMFVLCVVSTVLFS